MWGTVLTMTLIPLEKSGCFRCSSNAGPGPVSKRCPETLRPMPFALCRSMSCPRFSADTKKVLKELWSEQPPHTGRTTDGWPGFSEPGVSILQDDGDIATARRSTAGSTRAMGRIASVSVPTQSQSGQKTCVAPCVSAAGRPPPSNFRRPVRQVARDRVGDNQVPK